MTPNAANEVVGHGERRVNAARLVVPSREEGDETVEWFARAWKALHTADVVQNQAVVLAPDVSDPDVASRAARPPHEVVAREVDAEPSVLSHRTP
jgi:hypothetical protein